MKKISTVFVRDYSDPKRPVLIAQVNPECQWVLDGEGVATRKYDGTCCLWDGQRWWTRREVKPGKQRPPGFLEVNLDATTGKTIGWEHAEQSGFAKALADALQGSSVPHPVGTYELVGPQVNGNPESEARHVLRAHADAEVSLDDRDHDLRDFDAICELVAALHEAHGWEGLVYHHPDGRMAKMKARDVAQYRTAVSR